MSAGGGRGGGGGGGATETAVAAHAAKRRSKNAQNVARIGLEPYVSRRPRTASFWPRCHRAAEGVTLPGIRAFAATLVLLATPSGALPPSVAALLLGRARSLVGTPYEFGGRLRATSGRTEGLDCLGLVFLAAEAASGCGWRSFSVKNVETVSRRELGAPVPGLSPIATAALRVEQLEPGDSLMLVGPAANPNEAPIARLDGVEVWVWHVGLYAGAGRWLVGDHFAGQVVETELLPYLAAHADTYAGLFVTRMASGPRPARCRAVR